MKTKKLVVRNFFALGGILIRAKFKAADKN